MFNEIFILSLLVTLSKARYTDNCESFGLKNVKDADSENNFKNVFCLNATDLTVYEVSILHDSEVYFTLALWIQTNKSFQALLFQISPTVSDINNKICEISGDRQIKWHCQPIVFLQKHIFSSQTNKVKRWVYLMKRYTI